ncbi:polysaccharide deacetylase family protein [Kitasatospora sp. MBT63]|uniref:polysaccharide deacetylase family protein n=1 Tax=Kitasatospora sp. MBT63 TaxID=1444768 RepID=UPI0006905EE2|nr:polysaccharide deacetylase family protein [Kitasatospora sp. MBT63]
MTDLSTAPRRRGLTHWVARLALAAVALTVLALPFYAGWKYYVFRRDVTPQAALADPVRLPKAEQAAWQSGAAALPDTAAPVVLTYHDISPKSDSQYIVTPDAFDQQLSALETAGYRTLTTDEFVDYLKGGPAPPRSVYITFDDGTNGLWVYADRILARHHMHAASYLITGKVGKNRPYYLSWDEISRMASSGRWDFQDHTHDLHWRGVVDDKGTEASALANRLWLPDQKRDETSDEYVARIGADLARSVQDFADHDLPKPQMFAYPFSEMSERGNLPVPGPSLQSLLEKTFAATLTDVSRRPLPAGRRAAAARQVQRLEVYQHTTAKDLVADVARWTLVPPVAEAALDHAEQWTRSDGSNDTGTGVLTGAGPYPAGATYVSADYLPMASADWTDYTATATVTDLADNTNVGLTARVGSLEPISVSVSRNTAVLYRGTGDKREQLASKPLVPAATHTVEVTVTGTTTRFTIDGRTELTATGTAVGGNATGGIALNVRNGAGGKWPAFSKVAVKQTAATGATAGPSQLDIAKAVLLDPAASWAFAPGESSSMKVGGDGLSPQGLALSDYAAYEQLRTASWTRYTVRGTVARLNTPQVSGALWARVGSSQAVSVEVSRRGVKVLSGSADNRKVVASKTLADADHHDVTITVGAEATWITVDDAVHLMLPAKGETGGVAYSAYRDVTRHAWPTVRNLKVTPAEVK